MKVMQIIPDLGIGGAEIMVENLSIDLVNAGIELKIISLYRHSTAITERLQKKNIDLICLNKKRGVDLKIVSQLYHLMKKFKPDVVHTHLYASSYAMLAAIFAKVPVRVHTVHNIATQEFGKINRIINWIFYRFFRVIPVSISPEIRKTVQNEYKLSKKDVAMIYNGIDLKNCLPKKNYRKNDQGFTIIHVGSFKKQKNHVGLIHSFRKVCDQFPESRLVLVGTGELENGIKQLVEQTELSGNVEFLGLQSNVFQFLNQADLFVLPSLWEGMPISLIEAMATGLPIVATQVGGVPDMIDDHHNGLIVDVDNDKIASAMMLFIEDQVLRERLGTKARIDSDLYSVANMRSRYVSLYQDSQKKIEKAG